VEFAQDEVAVDVEGVQGFEGVAFGEVDLDDESVGGFPEGFGGHGFEGGLEGFAVSAGVEVGAGDLFEHVEAELAEAFAFQEDPVVVPAGEQVVSAGGEGAGDGVGVVEVGGGVDEVVDVEAYGGVEADGVAVGEQGAVGVLA
jgi:hypothetical protein